MCGKQTHQQTFLSESKAQQILALGTPGRYSDSYLGTSMDTCICDFCQKGAWVAKHGCRSDYVRVKNVILGALGGGEQCPVTVLQNWIRYVQGKGCRQEACRPY